MNHQVVFTDDDIKCIKCPIHLEQTGLIVKHSIGNSGGEMYQFKHLAFQEYLCSLYLCLNEDVSKYKTNRELTSCAPTILGIQHLASEQSNQLFVEFYQNMIAYKNTYITSTLIGNLKARYHRRKYKTFINRQINNITMVRNFVINDDKTLKCDYTDYRFIELIRNELIIINQSSEGFGKADLDLVRMAGIIKMLRIIPGESCNYVRYSGENENYSFFFIPPDHKQTIPTAMVEPAREFLIDWNNLHYVTDESFYNLFYILADLIEHVLANEGKSLHFSTLNERLADKLQSDFGQRAHFNKRIFVSLYKS